MSLDSVGCHENGSEGRNDEVLAELHLGLDSQG